MKFLNSLHVLAAVLYIAFQLSGLWEDSHSVSFGDNGIVFYASGATQEEAQKLATLFEQSALDNADMKLERDGDTNILVMKMIPKSDLTNAQLQDWVKFIGPAFDEDIIVAACDDEFNTLYESKSFFENMPSADEVSQTL